MKWFSIQFPLHVRREWNTTDLSALTVNYWILLTCTAYCTTIVSTVIALRNYMKTRLERECVNVVLESAKSGYASNMHRVLYRRWNKTYESHGIASALCKNENRSPYFNFKSLVNLLRYLLLFEHLKGEKQEGINLCAIL